MVSKDHSLLSLWSSNLPVVGFLGESLGSRYAVLSKISPMGLTLVYQGTGENRPVPVGRSIIISTVDHRLASWLNGETATVVWADKDGMGLAFQSRIASYADHVHLLLG